MPDENIPEEAPRTGLDADVAKMREELDALKSQFSATISEYQTANRELWARLQQQTPTVTADDTAEDTSVDVFNSIMKR